MGIFSKSGSGEKKVLVFDIGSSSVGGAMFRTTKSGIPKIVFSVREPVTLEKELNADKFLSQTSKSLETVAAKICAKGLGRPDKIFCVLSSPWYASQTRTISLSKNTPFTFTSKLADELIAKEISLFEEEHFKKYLETGNKIIAIELKNLKTMLNGYTTSTPFNQKAKELEMVMFVSMSGEPVLAKIKDTILKHFHSEAIKFSSFTIASFTVARDIFANHEDFLLIDVGGEVTDISMVKKEILRESISFPMGPNFMIRGVANELGCDLAEAKSLISLYKDGHAENNVDAKLAGVIGKLKAEWLKKFQESLTNLSNDISIPSTIFVTVDQDLANFFAETIKSEQLNQYTLTESKFKVIFLGTEALHGSATFEKDAQRDSFLIIDAVYINRFLVKM